MNFHLTIKDRNVYVFQKDETVPQPLLIFNSNLQNVQAGLALYQKSLETCPAYTFVMLTDIVWDHDLSPGNCPPTFVGDQACTPGAMAYKEFIIHQVIPAVQENTKTEYTSTSIAGYSMAGLFALYAGLTSDCFDKVLSASGSMWFPGFVDFVKETPKPKQLSAVYLSLGRKEKQARNTYYQSVEADTEEICKELQEKGIETTFVLQPGGHMTDPMGRILQGITWILHH